MSISTIIAAVLALISLGGGLFGWGLFRNKRAQWEAEQEALKHKERADHAAKTAEIFARPKPATWADTVDEL